VTEIDRLRLYTQRNITQEINASFLEEVVPGFRRGYPTPLAVYYHQAGATRFHRYAGGPSWSPRVPSEIAKSGDVSTVTVEVLTPERFIEAIPQLTFIGPDQTPWTATVSAMGDLELLGNRLRAQVVQDPPVEKISGFEMSGEREESLGFVKGTFFLEFRIVDVFGNRRHLRLYSDGRMQAWLGLKSGGGFRHVRAISSDGTRLRIGIGPDASRTDFSTIYVDDPSSIYSLGEMREKLAVCQTAKARRVYQIEGTKPLRMLERVIIQRGNKYDSGRIGAEIAYAISKCKFGLEEIVLVEPAKGGRDLYTRDGRAVMQSRMLRMTDQPFGRPRSEILRYELDQMIWKLTMQDFPNNPSARVGYAMLSYSDGADLITTTVLEVLHREQRSRHAVHVESVAH
jgi:hypothetical protein